MECFPPHTAQSQSDDVVSHCAEVQVREDVQLHQEQ